jgi:hypothetical protein
MDLTEARDRLADHIKVLSDELGDREVFTKKQMFIEIRFFFKDQSRKIIN